MAANEDKRLEDIERRLARLEAFAVELEKLKKVARMMLPVLRRHL